MAGAADALAGSPMGSAPQSLAGTTSADVVKGYKANIGRLQQIDKEEVAVNNRGDDLIQATQDLKDEHTRQNEARRLEMLAKSPVPEKPKDAPEFKQGSALQAWGSQAMLIAMIGSFFTRTPMRTALNAATAAMKAFQAKDLETYNIKFKEWQTQSANATKMFEYEDRAYQKALAELDKHEGQERMSDLDRVRTVEMKIKNLAQSFRDQRMLVVAEKMGLDGVEKALRDQQQQFYEMERAQASLAREAPDMVAFQTLQDSPEYQKAVADAKAGVLGAHKRVTDMTIESIPRYAAAHKEKEAADIEKVSEFLNKQGPGVLYNYNRQGDNLRKEIKDFLVQHPSEPLDLFRSSVLKSNFGTNEANGKAIRGFILNLIKQDRSLPAEAETGFFAKLNDVGASLSHEEARLLLHAIEHFDEDNKRILAAEVEAAARRVDETYGGGGDVIRRDAVAGLDVSKYVPHVASSKPASRSGGIPKPPSSPTPPRGAQDFLRKHPNTKHDFDQQFGSGWADFILQEGGATGKRSSGGFPAGQ